MIIKCPRCRNETAVHITNKFNTEEICTVCKDGERAYLLYAEAARAERKSVWQGIYNFSGMRFLHLGFESIATEFKDKKN